MGAKNTHPTPSQHLPAEGGGTPPHLQTEEGWGGGSGLDLKSVLLAVSLQ